ncbi:hypothetical protein D3C77_324000 [compost metagenome]
MESTSTPPLAPDLMANAGGSFVRMLREVAQDAKATEGIRNDWTIIRLWLGDCDSELSADHLEKIGKAWRAYLAIGLAPSHELQPVFDAIHERFNTAQAKRDRPPIEIMKVFERMLASDAQIKAKRASDAKAEGEKLAKIIGRLPGNTKKGWWSRQSRSLRGWIFVSVAWAAVALFILTVFDPLDVRSWDWADERDYLKAMAIMLLPAVAGLLKAAYSKATG